MDVERYDAGTYVCRAENRLGRTESSVVLTVEGEGGEQPVVITEEPHDMAAPRGATVQLPCRATGEEEGYGNPAVILTDFFAGSPLPEISWMKDGESMPDSSRHRQSPDGSLVMFNVTEADSGMYECVADNGNERRTARYFTHAVLLAISPSLSSFQGHIFHPLFSSFAASRRQWQRPCIPHCCFH